MPRELAAVKHAVCNKRVDAVVHHQREFCDGRAVGAPARMVTSMGTKHCPLATYVRRELMTYVHLRQLTTHGREGQYAGGACLPQAHSRPVAARQSTGPDLDWGHWPWPICSKASL